MLKSLSLKNYRNIASLDTEFNEDLNIIIAKNGSGKTNLLESIYYSVYGSSFRPQNSVLDIISLNSEFGSAVSKWDIGELSVRLSKEGNKAVTLNSKKIKQSLLLSRFPLTLFAPNSVDVVLGEPEFRRIDINTFLVLVDQVYFENIQRYKIILKNKNALLKQIQKGFQKKENLNFWNDQLVDLASKIYEERVKYFTNIEKYFRHLIEQFATKERYTVAYIPGLKPEENLTYGETLKQKIENNTDKEIIVGKSLYGVHKDDFGFYLNSQNIKYIGSRGQQRIALLLLKFSQALLLEELLGTKPLILLDDVMSELDLDNRGKIAEYIITSGYQTIITTAEKNEIPKSLIDKSSLILVS